MGFKPDNMGELTEGAARPRRYTAVPRLMKAGIEAARKAAIELEEQVRSDPESPRGDVTFSLPISIAGSADAEEGDGTGFRTPSTVGSRTPDSSPTRRSSFGGRYSRRVSFAIAPEVVHIDEPEAQSPAAPEVEEDAAAVAAARGRAVSATATCSRKDVLQGSLVWRAAVAHGSVATAAAAMEVGSQRQVHKEDVHRFSAAAADKQQQHETGRGHP